MFLSQETVSVLKNFSTISQSIVIKKGKKLRTLSLQKNILAEADILEEFDQEVGIYDLNRFLSCLSLIRGGEINLNDRSIVISDGKENIDFRTTSPDMIQPQPPEKELKLPSEDVQVSLTADHLDTIKKAAAVLQVPDMSFVGDGETVYLTVNDKKNTGSNSYKIEVGETEHNFKFNMKVDLLKVLPDNYDVIISQSKFTCWQSHARPLRYLIALEPDSTFNS